MDNPRPLEDFIALGQATIANSVANSTKTQYERCWAEWERFCQMYGLIPLEASPTQARSCKNLLN